MTRFPIPVWRLLILSLLALLLAGHAEAFGQPQFSLSAYLMRDDNAFRSYNQTNDWIRTFSGTGAYTWGKENWALQTYYNGDYSQFSEYTERQNTAHRVGFGLSGMLGDAVVGSVGASWRGRFNQADYKLYNTREYNFFTNLRWNPSPASLLTAGITMGQTYFTEVEEITNNEYQFNAAFQKFFQTRTSVKFTGALGHKVYPNQTILTGTNTIVPRLSRSYEEPVQATQTTLGLTIGQSLWPKTGLSLSGGTRQYLSDPIQQLMQDEYIYTENDLFDDPYASESSWSGATLTHQFAVGFQMKIGADFQWKDYKGTPAWDNAGNKVSDVRQDMRKEYYFTISKSFRTFWAFPNKIEVFSNLMLRDNASNDEYYDYFDHIGLLGFTLGF